MIATFTNNNTTPKDTSIPNTGKLMINIIQNKSDAMKEAQAENTTLPRRSFITETLEINLVNYEEFNKAVGEFAKPFFTDRKPQYIVKATVPPESVENKKRKFKMLKNESDFNEALKLNNSSETVLFIVKLVKERKNKSEEKVEHKKREGKFRHYERFKLNPEQELILSEKKQQAQSLKEEIKMKKQQVKSIKMEMKSLRKSFKPKKEESNEKQSPVSEPTAPVSVTVAEPLTEQVSSTIVVPTENTDNEKLLLKLQKKEEQKIWRMEKKIEKQMIKAQRKLEKQAQKERMLGKQQESIPPQL